MFRHLLKDASLIAVQKLVYNMLECCNWIASFIFLW